jgi:hypothetical protein
MSKIEVGRSKKNKVGDENDGRNNIVNHSHAETGDEKGEYLGARKQRRH